MGARACRGGDPGSAAPDLPPPWTEQPTAFTWAQDGWATSFTRPGRPDLLLTARPSNFTVSGPVVVRLGSRQGVLVGGPVASVQWQVDDLFCTLQLMPFEP